MPHPAESESTPSHVLREIIPIDSPISTGGKFVDAAMKFWFEWRDAAAGLPDWAAFEPFKHASMLPNVLVAKREGDHYRCILVGEAIRENLSTKIEGALHHEAMPSINADDVRMRLDHALKCQLPNYVEKTMAWVPDREFVRYRTVHLPFHNDKDKCSRILTVADFETRFE